MRVLLLSTLLTSGACGGAAPRDEGQLMQAPSQSPAASEEDVWSGEYTLSGSTGPDGCNAQIVLLAEHVRIDVASRVFFADVVDRTYTIEEVSPTDLRAEGRFPIDVCNSATIFERWTLSKSADGFAGVLESTWPNPSNCSQVCSVSFQLDGAPR